MRPVTRRGFASNEFLIVIAAAAVGLAIAIPVVARTYPLILSKCTSVGETPGWLEYLLAAGLSVLPVAGMVLILWLGLLILGQGIELVSKAWSGLMQARSDLERNWRDRA